MTTPTLTEEETRNFRVARRYDELMHEGKHGHYETLFRVVREECERDHLSAGKTLYGIKRRGKLCVNFYLTIEDADRQVGWGNNETGPRSKAEIVVVKVIELETLPPSDQPPARRWHHPTPSREEWKKPRIYPRRTYHLALPSGSPSDAIRVARGLTRAGLAEISKSASDLSRERLG